MVAMGLFATPVGGYLVAGIVTPERLTALTPVFTGEHPGWCLAVALVAVGVAIASVQGLANLDREYAALSLPPMLSLMEMNQWTSVAAARSRDNRGGPSSRTQRAERRLAAALGKHRGRSWWGQLWRWDRVLAIPFGRLLLVIMAMVGFMVATSYYLGSGKMGPAFGPTFFSPLIAMQVAMTAGREAYNHQLLLPVSRRQWVSQHHVVTAVRVIVLCVVVWGMRQLMRWGTGQAPGAGAAVVGLAGGRAVGAAESLLLTVLLGWLLTVLVQLVLATDRLWHAAAIVVVGIAAVVAMAMLMTRIDATWPVYGVAVIGCAAATAWADRCWMRAQWGRINRGA